MAYTYHAAEIGKLQIVTTSAKAPKLHAEKGDDRPLFDPIHVESDIYDEKMVEAVLRLFNVKITYKDGDVFRQIQLCRHEAEQLGRFLIEQAEDGETTPMTLKAAKAY